MKKKSFIAVSFLLVLFLSIITLKVSFSYISPDPNGMKIKKIYAGNLSLSLNVKALENIIFYKTEESDLPQDEKSEIDSPYSEVKIINIGNLKSMYEIYLTYDTGEYDNVDDVISFEYLLLGIYDKDNNKWVKFDDKYYLDFRNFLNNDNYYKVLSDVINEKEENNSVRNYYFYLWLKSDTPKSEIGKKVNLKIDMDSKIYN